MFEKGHKKYGGRKAGTKNKTNSEIRLNASIMLQSQLDNLEKKLPTLNDADYIKAIALLFKVVLPAQKQIETETINHPTEFQIEIVDKIEQATEKQVDTAIDKWVENSRNK